MSYTKRAWTKYSKKCNKVTTAPHSTKSIWLSHSQQNFSPPKTFVLLITSCHARKQNPGWAELNCITVRSSHARANLLNNVFPMCFSHCTNLGIYDIQPQLTVLAGLESHAPSKKCSKEVHQLLSRYKLYTASGPDGISSWVLHDTASSICYTVTYIINQSLERTNESASWRTAYITPIT